VEERKRGREEERKRNPRPRHTLRAWGTLRPRGFAEEGERCKSQKVKELKSGRVKEWKS
jgi:hypothetical protein